MGASRKDEYSRLAALVAATRETNGDLFGKAMVDWLRLYVGFDHCVIFGYRGASRPPLLFETFSPAESHVFVALYQEGPYLLDPFHHAAVERKEGFWRMRELAPDEAAEPDFAEALAWMKRENVSPQIILYDPAEAVRLADMIQRGMVPWPDIPVLYVLGRYTVLQTSQPADLLPFLAPNAPRFSHWSVCAFGRHEAACVTAAALLGGHVRVGFENNLHLPDGCFAPSNAALVGAVANAAQGLGMEICNADELRARPVSSA